MEDIKLIPPDIQYRDSYVEAMREGLYLVPATEEDILLAARDFGAYMAKRRDLNFIFTLPGGQKARRVPSTEFWLVKGDDRFLGRVSVRHELSEHLRRHGGHIGYAVRKSERGKGYGRFMLEQALVYAKKIGLEKVLLTCNDDIVDSIKIIEGAGGVLQDKISIEGRPMLHRRYWIEL